MGELFSLQFCLFESQLCAIHSDSGEYYIKYEDNIFYSIPVGYKNGKEYYEESYVDLLFCMSELLHMLACLYVQCTYTRLLYVYVCIVHFINKHNIKCQSHFPHGHMLTNLFIYETYGWLFQ